MTAAKPKSGSRFAVNDGAAAISDVKDAVVGANAADIVNCAIWRRGTLLADATGAKGELNQFSKLMLLDFLFPEGSCTSLLSLMPSSLSIVEY